jgi:large repetitive protein
MQLRIFFLASLTILMWVSANAQRMRVIVNSVSGSSSNYSACMTTNNISISLQNAAGLTIGSSSISQPSMGAYGNDIQLYEGTIPYGWVGRIIANGAFRGPASCSGLPYASLNDTIVFNSSICHTKNWSSGLSSQYLLTMTVSFVPVLDITGTAPGNFCANSAISLTGSPNFNRYVWQRQSAQGDWANFTTGVSPTPFTYSTLFADPVAASENLDKPLAFRYTVGTCPISVASGNKTNYTFFPVGPTINEALSSTVPPTCASGNQSTDGKMNVVLNNYVSGYEYIYSVKQYVPQNGGACPAGQGKQFGIPPTTFCAGNIANFVSKTASSEFNNTNKVDAVDPAFRFRSAWYEVVVESRLAKTNNLSCPSNTYQFFIANPPSVSVSTVSGSPTSPNCIGGNDGTGVINILNGRSNFSWEITGATTSNGSATTAGEKSVSSLRYGANTVTVTDGCGQTAQTIINVPQSATTLAISSSTTAPTCNANGSVSFNINQIGGHMTGYAYTLHNISDPFNPFLVSSLTNDDLSGSFSSLNDQYVYRITATSPNLCTAISDIDLNPPPSIAGTFSKRDVECYNGSDGALIFNSTGGSTSLNFLVDGNTPDPPEVTNSAFTFDGYATGNYTLRVTDECLSNTGAVTKYLQQNISVGQPSNPIAFTAAPGQLTDEVTIFVPCADDVINGVIGINYGIGNTVTSLTRDGQNIVTTDNVAPFNLVNLSRGNYAFTVQDNCRSIAMAFEVSGPATNITASIEKSILNTPYHLACAESHNGVVTVLINGGIKGVSPDYHLEILDASQNALVDNLNFPVTVNGSISNGVSSPLGVSYTISGLSANIQYELRVTDFNNNGAGVCTRNFPIGNLTAPNPLLIDNVDDTDLTNESVNSGLIYVQCNGDTNINFVSGISGGNAPYTVSLSRNTTNSWPGQQVVFANNVLDQSAEFANLSAGWYRVDVEDTRGCASSFREFQIHEASQSLQVQSIIPSTYQHGGNTACYGYNNASITISALGGVLPYTYRLLSNDGSPDRQIENLANQSYAFTNLPAIQQNTTAITYTTEVVDVLGCAWMANDGVNRDLVLQSPAPVEFSFAITSVTHDIYEIPCKGELAEISVSSSGGLFPHTVTIVNTSGPAFQLVGLINSVLDVAVFEVPVGNYSIRVNDELDCAAPMQAFSLHEPPTEVVLQPGLITPPVCVGGEDGRIQVAATGGMPGNIGNEYRFVIREHEAVLFEEDTLTGTSTTFIKGANHFNSQLYDVEVLDRHGCTSTATVMMPVNPQSLTLTPVTLVAPSCYGGDNGSITLAVANHSVAAGSTLKFSITGGQFGNNIQIAESETSEVTFENIQGTAIAANTPYRVWVDDDNHCVDTAYQYQPNLNLVMPPNVQINLVESNRPSCFGGQDGSLEVNVSGGVPGYTYSFDNISYSPANASGDVIRSGLTAGVHAIFIRDANYVASQSSCQWHAEYIVENGRWINILAEVQQVNCRGNNDGAIALGINLQNPNINEVFNEGDITYSWTRDLVSSLPFTSTKNVASLFAGNYSVRVNYPVGTQICSNQKTIHVAQPVLAFEIDNIKLYDARCGHSNDGRAVVTVTGGWAGELSYYRVDQGTWRMFSGNTFIISGLVIGLHNVEIAQRNFQCTHQANFTVDTATLPLSLNAIIPPSCPNASDAQVILTAVGNNVEYAFANDDFQPTPIFSALLPGTYRFVARQINQIECKSDTIEVMISNPSDCGNGPLVGFVTNVIDATCEFATDGEALIAAHGGVPPYNYLVDDRLSSVLQTVNSLSAGAHKVVVIDAMGAEYLINFTVGISPQLNADIFISNTSCSNTCDGSATMLPFGGSGDYEVLWQDNTTTLSKINLCVGEYSVRIVDHKNSVCFITKSVVVSSYPQIESTIVESTPPTCPGGSDGRLRLDISGGSGAYQYSWDTGITEKNLDGCHAGNHNITITDQLLGCVIEQAFFLPDPLPIKVESLQITQPNCAGQSNGNIKLLLSNVVSPLVTWSNGKIGLEVSGVNAGIYYYSAVGSNGCVIVGEVEVVDRQTLSASETITTPLCNNSSDGKIQLIASGGTSPYSVNWLHGPKGLLATNLSSGEYSYRITDRFGCSHEALAHVTSPDAIEIASTKSNPTCYGKSDGWIEIISLGGTADHKFSWGDNILGSSRTGLSKGSYTVIVEDKNLCHATKTIVLSDPTILALNTLVKRNPSCTGLNDGEISVIAVGGTSPYRFLWEDNDTTTIHNNLSAGVYAIKLMDSKGCVTTKQLTLTSPNELTIFNIQKVQPTCFGEATGSISLEADGGTPGYTFKWNEITGDRRAVGLTSGIYTVNVTDRNGCSRTEEIDLGQPQLKIVEGIPSETILCEGGQTTLRPTQQPWSAYRWINPLKMVSNSASLTTGIQGNYTFTGWDQAGCPSEFPFKIVTTSNPIDADFLLLSEAVTFEPLVFVDISLPVPEGTTWIIPEDPDVNIARQKDGLVELVFSRSGDFQIGFTASMGDCESTVYKIVTIEESDSRNDNSEGRGGQSLDEQIEIFVHPNPVSDYLTIELRLSTSDRVELSLYPIAKNYLVKHETVEGSLGYELTWDLNKLEAGVHTLVIRHKEKLYMKKIVVLR